MTKTEYTNNPFLEKLLSLQQDGNQAISAPTNWTQAQPLLQVETELDNIIRDLSHCSLGASERASGRWHFFIGSPGNGKSAAVGEMVRTIITERQCTVVDEHGVDIRELGSNSVPYWLDVKEPGNRFVTLRIVQDASVVRNPYADDVDPARDLLDTLIEAWGKGISLVVCTNRGVLEKAYRDTHTNAEFNQQPWHKVILKQLAERSNGEALDVNGLRLDGAGKKVFSSVDARATFLDNRSLILGDRGILDQLIQKAVTEEHWKKCASCEAARLCPFKANRDWLADSAGRSSVVHLLQRAEVLSSQVIVFREALAAISFILAGCSRDYRDTSPCGWVHRRVEENDLFALLSRRLYASIFMSTTNRGLDAADPIRDIQLDAIQNLRDSLDDGSRFEKQALTGILEKPAPSTDVGVSRLFGTGGVFDRLDAIKGPLSPEFLNRWDGNYAAVQKLDLPGCSELESRCAATWHTLENAAEALGSHEASQAFWAIRRWSSAFTLRLGALQESQVIAGSEIDEFAELLALLGKDAERRTLAEKRRLKALADLVAQLLNREEPGGTEHSALHLADNVEVDGPWLREHLRPRVDASSASGSLTIAVRFGNARDSTSLAASTFLWLRQRARGTMDHRCIPDDLLSEAMDAKARAAAKSGYAYTPDDVTVRIHLRSEVFELSRFDGEVDARVHS